MGFENPLPAGALVEAQGLSAEALNGLRGRVLGPAGPERISVGFGEGTKAIKPENLKVIELEPPKGVVLLGWYKIKKRVKLRNHVKTCI